MKSKLLHIELLKYLLDRSKYFGFVEIKPFLLQNFPEEPELRERKKMRAFLKFLSSEDYIEVRDKRGIYIIKEAGMKVAREDVSAIVKIKPKGVNLVEQNQLNSFNKGGIILSSILGLSTLLFGIYSIYTTQNNSDLKKQIDSLNKENIILQTTKESTKLHLEKLNEEIERTKTKINRNK